LLLAALAALTPGHAAHAQLPITLGAEGQRPTLAPLLKQVTPAVVNISVTSTASPQANPLMQDPFFRRFFDLPERPQPMPQQSVGSGVIVDAAKGYVLTNHHVVENADDIMVTLADRRTLHAKLVGSDAGTDIALLQVDNTAGLTSIPIGDSDQLQVGDFVVAIGNPFALGQTVTSGIVSALGRNGINIEGYENFIQTDASINPGNSGGALIALDGKLVGINTAILAPAGGNVGIGFAIPSNMAKQVMAQLVEYGAVRRGRLGVSVQTLTPDLAEALGVDVNEGAIVNAVEPGSAGARAGLMPQDIIVGFGDSKVTSGPDLRNKVALAPVGSPVQISLLRDGKRRDVQARIAEAETAARPDAQQTPDRLAGAALRDLAPGDPQYGELQGVLVAGVQDGTPAARSGLRAGDVIVGVNRMPVKSAAELTRALRGAAGAVALSVARGDARFYVVLR
jgi:serine protease DegQ